MGGFLGIGASGAERQDRRDNLSARGKATNFFNYALPEAQSQQDSGKSMVGDSGAYFGRLLRAGRTETEQNAAPAINAQLSAADATKRREALTGTGRTGGTAEANRMASADTEGKVADIVNDTTQQQRKTGAEGQMQAGAMTLQNAMSLLGLSEDQIKSLMSGTEESRVNSRKLSNETAKAITGLAANFF